MITDSNLSLVVINSSIQCSVPSYVGNWQVPEPCCGRAAGIVPNDFLFVTGILLKLCMLPYMDEISLLCVNWRIIGLSLDASLNIIIVRRVLLVLVRSLRMMSKSYFIVHSCQNLTLPAMTRSRKKKNNSAMKLNLSRVHIWQRYSIHYRLSYYITLVT